jgi:DNA-binding response OmpR family regulator
MEILRAMRNHPSGIRVPIAILTSSRAQQDKIEATALGADRFITKPLDLRSFVGIVGRSLKELLEERKESAQNGV